MANVEEIDKAIGAYGAWKARLKSTIASGKTEIPVTAIRVDNECAFGKWLYGQTLTASDKATPDYRTVKDLHAQFHKVAGRVAESAVAGKKDEAERLLAGEFGTTSVKLTAAMMLWKKISK